MEQLLTSDQVAEMLAVPASTLRVWRYRKIGPRYMRVGKHCRYSVSDVEAWLEEQGSHGAA